MYSKNCFLIGKSIHLRTLTKEDIKGDRWVKWLNDQKNTYYMTNGTYPATEESQEDFFNNVVLDPKNLILGICLNSNQEHIGNLGLHNIDLFTRKAELGIILGESSEQKKGLSTEAIKLIVSHGFNRLNLHKVYLRTHEENIAAIKTFEKVGFKVEGIIREEFYHYRRWANSVYMGLLEDDFFQVNSRECIS